MTQTTHHFKPMSKYNLPKGIYQFAELQLNHYKASDFEGEGTVQAVANGTKVSDTLIAKDDSNWLLTGFHGDDLLIGRNGDDHLFGGEGQDTLTFNGGRDVLEGGSGADQFIFDLEYLSIEDTATITDFKDIGDKMIFMNVDPHLSMDIGIDGSAMVHANLGSGERGVVAVLTGLEGDENFALGNNFIELIG